MSVWFLPLLIVGCGTGINTVNVTGTVKYKDQPLTGGRLKIYNAKNEQVSGASITKDGSFTATDVPKEQVKVTVETDDSGMANMATKAPPGTPVIPSPAPAGKAVPVPTKYQKVATTDLSFTISEANQKLDIKLQ